MGNFRDISGMQFGKITAISHVDTDRFGKTRWSCICECGSLKIISSYHLVSGKTKSCGCLRTEEFRSDIIGMKFGCLTVVDYSGTDTRRKSVFECFCDCGNVINMRRNALLSGNTKSCGCRNIRKRLDPGISCFH